MLGFPDLSEKKILIVGDVMLDRYWYGSTSRVSPEAPVPVVKVNEMQERPGGAGNVALNCRALGAKSHLLGLIGHDEPGRILKQKISDAHVDSSLITLPDFMTVTKLRVLSRHQQLIRLDFEEEHHNVPNHDLRHIFEKQIDEMDAVILSDYRKGALQEGKKLIEIARQKQVPVLVDPKGRDFSAYKGATILTPNLKEFEMVVGPCLSEEELVSKGLVAINENSLEALLITRGEDGMTLLTATGEVHHLQAKAQDVFDVTGAGDTVIAVLASGLAAGLGLLEAVTHANIAASISVSKLGAVAVTPAEIRRASRFDNADQMSGVVSLEQLLMLVEESRSHGERIVMTNGCFDILHAGHVSYLAEARALGDRLIIAVNDDASVARLKGADRPINELSKRMTVLAGLASVDWVFPFSEDTPQNVINAILPEVLSKGGDYEAKDIVGFTEVTQNGGCVEILPFVDGVSTTKVIEKIEQNMKEEVEI